MYVTSYPMRGGFVARYADRPIGGDLAPWIAYRQGYGIVGHYRTRREALAAYRASFRGA